LNPAVVTEMITKQKQKVEQGYFGRPFRNHHSGKLCGCQHVDSIRKLLSICEPEGVIFDLEREVSIKIK